MSSHRFGVALLLVLALLGGCDQRKIAELEAGVSTESDVRAKFGEPEVVYEESNGNRTLEYPRQPAGQTNYMISIGPDGRMSALRQVLKPASFAQVTPGLDQAQVRRLLGKPAKKQAFESKDEEVWDWRFADGQESKVFSVVFDGDGKVISTGTTLDPKESGQVGR